jgi:hypothetical protein
MQVMLAFAREPRLPPGFRGFRASDPDARDRITH